MAAVLAWIAAGLALFFDSRRRTLGFFALWVPTTMLIESTFIPLEIIFEHRMYLPSVGMAGLLAFGIRSLLLRGGAVRMLTLGVATAIGCGLVLAPQLHLEAWRTDRSLWTAALRPAPGRARVHNDLGEALRNVGDWDGASSQYERAVELDPTDVHAVHNLRRAYKQKGMRREAFEQFQRALALDPHSAPTHYSLGLFYVERGFMKEAHTHFMATLAADPLFPQAEMFVRYVKRALASPPRPGTERGAPPGHP